MTDTLLNRHQVAKMLCVSERTLKRMIAQGMIPEVRLSSKMLRYRASDIARIIADGISRQLVVNERPPVAQIGNIWPDDNETIQRLGLTRPRTTR